MPERTTTPTNLLANPLANRLGEETSPYLLQHRDNPVAWQAWGPEAFEAARQAEKPVLLSIGYAACHWCHVMAHESFENPAIAAQMNEHFVNIKVDREERPDVDSIYQQAVALLGEQGGWPLTVFLTPDREPFWGGTYFPPEPRFGRPGFPQVLARLSQVYAEDPDGVAKNVAALTSALGKPPTKPPHAWFRRSTRWRAAWAGRRSFRSRPSSSCCGAPGNAAAMRAIARQSS